jgi:hypothetical protein
MKATEIIRGVLDLIDKVECSSENPDIEVIDAELHQDPIITGLDTNRFKHIFAMLDAERSAPPMYNNSPNAVVADIAAVTTDAGGGWNGPKNPADMKADSISLYPNFQAQPKG